MIASHLFDAFARSYEPPHWVIEKFLRSGPSDIRAALSAALQTVSECELASIDQDALAHARMLFATKDAELQGRLHVVARNVEASIGQQRVMRQPCP